MNQTLKYLQKLELIRSENQLRSLPDYTNCSIDFVSNDYLGLARKQFPGVKSHYFSGLGSRLIAGNSASAQRVEEFLGEIFNSDAALIFNSGYDANLGFFSTIPQKDEIVLYDQAIHASIRDGLRLSSASNFAFNHNDLEDLEIKLQRFQAKNKIVVVEGVYSMDGDQAPLNELMLLMEKHDAYLVVDEAHSLGVLGENGLGLSQKFCNHPNLLARIVTFGKALGAHGAAVLTNRDLRDYLIHTCRSFIYTTALPPESYARIQHCFEYLISENTLQNELNHVIQIFSNLFGHPHRHIQTIRIASIQAIKSITQDAKKEKIALKGVWSPTVSEGQERLRLSLHAFNNADQIYKLHQFLENKGYV